MSAKTTKEEQILVKSLCIGQYEVTFSFLTPPNFVKWMVKVTEDPPLPSPNPIEI